MLTCQVVETETACYTWQAQQLQKRAAGLE